MQPLQHPRPDVGEADPDRAEQPLLGSGTEEIHGRLREVEAHRARRLDGIDHQQGVRRKRRPEGIDIQPKAVPELHRADGHHPGALVAEPGDRARFDPSVARPMKAQLDPLPAQRHPRIHVGGKLTIDADHVVTVLPVEAGRYHSESGRGVFDERDGLGTRREELAHPDAHLGTQPFPVRQLEWFFHLTRQKDLHRGPYGDRQRGDRRVIQVGVPLGNRKQRTQLGRR